MSSGVSDVNAILVGGPMDGEEICAELPNSALPDCVELPHLTGWTTGNDGKPWRTFVSVWYDRTKAERNGLRVYEYRTLDTLPISHIASD